MLVSTVMLIILGNAGKYSNAGNVGNAGNTGNACKCSNAGNVGYAGNGKMGKLNEFCRVSMVLSM